MSCSLVQVNQHTSTFRVEEYDNSEISMKQAALKSNNVALLKDQLTMGW
jgi:hypothetical protein